MQLILQMQLTLSSGRKSSQKYPIKLAIGAFRLLPERPHHQTTTSVGFGEMNTLKRFVAASHPTNEDERNRKRPADTIHYHSTPRL
jgi:hypothetical protein